MGTLDYLKLLCKEGVKKKEDQSKSQDDLELKKNVPADQSCTFQDHNLYIPKNISTSNSILVISIKRIIT